MARSSRQTIVFLGTTNRHRSRVAEILFNAASAKLGLPWSAVSRGTTLDLTAKEPMAKIAITDLQRHGIRVADFGRAPIKVSNADLESAYRIVVLNRMELHASLQDRLATCAEKIEFWEIAISDQTVATIDNQVSNFITRLLSGGAVRDEPPSSPNTTKPASVPTPAPLKKKGTVRVGRETKGRRGKGVTLVWDIPLEEVGIEELATTLKQRCGTGGTVKDGRIEIQGDQRDRISKELERMGYTIKRVGG